MPAVAVSSVPPSTDVYRRQARRLRCRFAGQPAMLQLALKSLANANAPRNTMPIVNRVAPWTSSTGGSARRFVEYLADRVPLTVLRYSERLELLRAARQFGVGRFEANVLIATVLERHRRTPEEESSPRGSFLFSNVAIFVMIQTAVALGAWWTIFR